MKTFIRPAFSLFVILTAITGIAYPVAMTGFSKAVFPYEAEGSLIQQDGKTIGSSLIGQNFSDPAHFWGRPSASAPMPYNAQASGGSNLGPLNPAIAETATQRLAQLRAADPDNLQPVPIELLSVSGSGLDPHISPLAAQYQAPRVARLNHLGKGEVSQLIEQLTESRWMGILGEPRVNVVQLNLALAELIHKK